MTVYPSITEISCNRLIPYYLMSSYLYYKKDKAVLLDEDYDLMCKRILNEWKYIKHPHKSKVKKTALEAGTGYNIKKYPTITMSAAEMWYTNWEKENE
tara:strand:- start:701 stop:994 length:294 start_codon:yes stop_codon:yes gene_type:complete